jgi:ABC-type polysaccharide/polyol phosphate transport system ATPase subunit
MASIEFEHVSKSYQLGSSRTSLREAINQIPRKLFKRNNSQIDDQLIWAVDDVSFQVEPGEVLGIIGPNGAGKSTILKLLSKITYPTHGHIKTHGRMAALIELGAGFHPDLSGRENIYLNGSILGLRRKEIDSQLPMIVEFAGLERFIDTPIKRYSSGMYVRLAFAVAAHVKADLMLVDEVLSVGDMSFQQKSLAKMLELRNKGATIIFVSHNLTAVKTFCNTVLFLRKGQVMARGDPAQVIKTYENVEQESRQASLERLREQDTNLIHAPRTLDRTDKPSITKVELLNSSAGYTHDFSPTEPLIVRVHFSIPNGMATPVCVVRVRRRSDGANCFMQYFDHPCQANLRGTGMFEARFEQTMLLPGAYLVETMIHNSYYREDAAEGDPEPLYITGRIRSESAGIYQPVVCWSFDSTE